MSIPAAITFGAILAVACLILGAAMFHYAVMRVMRDIMGRESETVEYELTPLDDPHQAADLIDVLERAVNVCDHYPGDETSALAAEMLEWRTRIQPHT